MSAIALPQPNFWVPKFEPWRLLRPLRMDGQFFPRQRLHLDGGDLPSNIGASAVPVSFSFIDEVSTTSNQTTYSWTSRSLGTAASDRIIVVEVGAGGGTDYAVISSGSIGGETATTVSGAAIGRNCFAGLMYASVPTGGTGTISITFSGSKGRCYISWWALYGADTTHTDADEKTSETFANSINLTNLTVPSGGAAFFSFQGTTGAAGTWSGATERTDSSHESSNRHSSADTDIEGTNTVTFTMGSSSDERTIAGLAFGPA